MRTDIIEQKETILKMIKDNEPKSRISKILNCKPITLNGYLKNWGVVYNGNMGLKGKKTDSKRKTASEYSKKDNVSAHRLRLKLIEDGIKKDECETCGSSMWLGKKLSLELHHKDGDRYNNDFENLQILCPNCHSTTESYAGKKKRLPRIKRKMFFCQKCGTPVNNKIFCKKCNDEIGSIRRKIERPSYEELVKEIKEIGYSATGKKYGVSDNAIRKWKKYYENHTPMA